MSIENKVFLSIGAAIALCLIIGAGAYFAIDATAERLSHSKTKKALEVSEQKIEAATVERDSARLETAEAKGREQMLAAELERVNQAANHSEVRLTTARKQSEEAKVVYEKKRNQVTIIDNRPFDVKRDELRARLKNRGIVVTER